MAFYSGSSTMPGILNMIADKLIASDSLFSNPYSSLTRYTGDGNDVEYGITCYQRRVLKWEDPAKSGQEKTMYIVFQIPFWDVNQAMFQTRSDAGYYMFGIEVIISTSWNNTTHSPDGDIQRTFIPVVQWGTAGMSNTQKAALLVHNLAYWMWVDDDALSPGEAQNKRVLRRLLPLVLQFSCELVQCSRRKSELSGKEMGMGTASLGSASN